MTWARYGIRLKGAGAIATKARDGGGTCGPAGGPSKDDRLVGRGGNQSDMVCDEVFDRSVITAFTWPTGYPAPMQVGFASLPIVTPAPKARRDLVLSPPTQLELPAGLVPAPKVAKDIITKGVPAGGAAGGIGFFGTGSPLIRGRQPAWRWSARARLAAPFTHSTAGSRRAMRRRPPASFPSRLGGVDVSSIAAQVPSWAWPIALICITALFQFLRNLADSRHKEELADTTASTQEN